MTIKKISYENKVKTQDDPEKPRKNKITDEDLNEIKEVVNNNADLLDNKVDKVDGKGLSTEDFTTAEKQKLAGLNNYNDAEIKQDISDIKKEQQTQNNNIKNLQKNDAQQDKSIEALQKENTELKEECSRLRQDLNAFPSGQAEGEYITLNDSADSRFNMFRVGGNSEQETREGYNILKEKYRQVTRSLSYILDKSKLTEKMYYSLIADFSSSSTNRIFLNNISASIQAINKGSMNIVANQKSTKEITFTAEELETLKNSEEDIIIQLYENDTNIDYSTKNFSEVMLSSSNNTKYEEYGAMPSPEYPSEIENVENNANIVVCNKNLANPEEVWENMHAHKASSCSEVIEDGRDCILFANSQFRGDVDNPFNLINYKYKENTAYTIRAMVKAYNIPESGSGSLTFQLIYSDGTLEMHFLRADQASNFTELRVVSAPDKTLLRVAFSYGTSNQWYIDKSSIFIAEGDITDYVEYKGQNYKFPLEEGQRLMLGDYLADDGIHHKRKQYEFDGTESFTRYRNYPNSYGYRFNLSGVKTNTNVLCTKYKYTPFSDFYNEETDVAGEVTTHNSSDNLIYFGSSKATAEEFKEEIKGSILEYEMLEEEIEPYTEEQKKVYDQMVQTAKSYKNVTNIYSPDLVSLINSVNYRKDIETLLTQQNALILEGGN